MFFTLSVHLALSKTYLLNTILIEEYIKEGNESLKMKQGNFLLFVDEETSRPRGETKADQNLFSGGWSQSSLLRDNFLHAVLLSRKKSVYRINILGFHSRDKTAILVYRTKAKCRSSFA